MITFAAPPTSRELGSVLCMGVRPQREGTREHLPGRTGGPPGGPVLRQFDDALDGSRHGLDPKRPANADVGPAIRNGQTERPVSGAGASPPQLPKWAGWTTGALPTTCT